MADTFTLKIELGNEAMEEPRDVAEALRRVANEIDAGHGNGRIRDANGNTVGNWSYD